jgi:hypothetical protein
MKSVSKWLLVASILPVLFACNSKKSPCDRNSEQSCNKEQPSNQPQIAAPKAEEKAAEPVVVKPVEQAAPSVAIKPAAAPLPSAISDAPTAERASVETPSIETKTAEAPKAPSTDMKAGASAKAPDVKSAPSVAETLSDSSQDQK